MTAKEFIVNDLKKEKESYIDMIRNNNLSDEERKVINEKIDALDTRIENANALEDNDNTKEKVEVLNAKIDAMREKLNKSGVKIEGLADGEYLKSQNAVHDFADCLRKCSKEQPFKKMWADKLSKNGVAFDSDATEMSFIPTPVATYIADAWERGAGAILREFRYVGVNRYPVAVNMTDQNAEEARAKGHVKGNRKSEQTINLVGFEINTQFVYKIQTIYNKMEFASDGSLIQYVIDELMTQWSYEVLRAVLVGDGRAESSVDHISSIVPITDVTSIHGAGFVTTYNAAQGSATTLEYFMDNMIANIEDGTDDILLFVSRADYQAMRKFINGVGGTPTYMNETQLAQAMGVRRIVITDYLTTEAGTPRAIAVHANKYTLIGSLNPDFLSWEEPWDNNRAYRVEMLVGGDATAPNMASIIVNA